MKYTVQSNWSLPRRDDGWKTFGLDPNKRFDDLDQAINNLVYNSNLARIVCDIRVIDEDGKVYARYVPDHDTRLPGCRWQLIQNAAYLLWERAGRPEGRSDDFWLQAEQGLGECKGVFIGEELNMV